MLLARGASAMYDQQDTRPSRPGLVWRWPVARRRAWLLGHPRLLFALAVLVGVIALLIAAGSARAL
jgi:hypothetical protein